MDEKKFLIIEFVKEGVVIMSSPLRSPDALVGGAALLTDGVEMRVRFSE